MGQKASYVENETTDFNDLLKSGQLFENLIWLTTEEAAFYLRKTANAVRILVFRQILKPRKFRRRLYFRKTDLDAGIDSSFKVNS